MGKALEQAVRAQQHDEVPVGAVVVSDDVCVGQGYNQPISSTDATAHAEIVALRTAAHRLGNYRLPQATVYVTLEPCMMCTGALVHARVERLVFGAYEPKAGVIVSHPLADSEWLNHRFTVRSGVLERECGQLLSEFFAAKRGVE